jgi:HTH-type transcriptional regulator/antitoxin HigA
MIQALADNPVTLIERGAPHRIHTDEELALYTRALFRLTAKEAPTEPEQETIDLLTLLIEDYESKYRLPAADPVEVLKYLMERSGLQQKDLQPELGTLSNISMVLSGKRNVTLTNASALAARFDVDIRLFLPVPRLASTRQTRGHARSKAAKTKSFRSSGSANRQARPTAAKGSHHSDI